MREGPGALSVDIIYDPVARTARDWLSGSLNTRTPSNLGAPLASLPQIQARFGEIEALLAANRATLAVAIAASDTEPDVAGGGGAVMAKHLVTVATVRKALASPPARVGLARENVCFSRFVYLKPTGC